MNKSKFTSLHNHSDYSILDGLGKIQDYVSRAKELGMSAIALTDHGTMAGLVTLYDECQKQDIKFIGGCEFYVAPEGYTRFQKDKVKGLKPYNHLIVLFKNEIGYKNGCFLLTRSNTEGFYYKPRIDFDLLKEHKEGLIVMSACLAGAVPRAIIDGDIQKAEDIVKKYKETFGDDYYLEIQDHGLPEDHMVTHELMRLSQKYNIKLVATNDCHYVYKDDKEAHDWLMCMQMDKKITDNDHLIEGDYYLKSEQEMLNLFPYCPDAVYNTQEIVDKCNFNFEYGNYRMPKVTIPEEYNGNYFEYLKDEAWKGFEYRYPKGHKRREEAKERLKYELDIIKQMHFAEYFLDIRKTIKNAKDNNVLVGPGRGSGAGSCMNYCLGITDIEPLQYDLLFERFLNPERISMPDIDTDFDNARKDDVIAWEADSNGKDCFAKIGTFGTMKAKNALKGCAKVSGIANHVQVGNALAKFITPCNSLMQEWEINPDLQEYVNSSSILKKIWEIAVKLEGTKKSLGTHACGHIPTPVPCEQLFPCRVDKETGYLICEYDMTQAEHLGNLKKDLLMLSNLTIIGAAQKEIKKRYNIDIPLWTQDILNDKKALEMVASGDTNGVFQLESDGMKKFMKQLQPSCFEDIIAGVALYRPGPMDYIPEYVENKHNPGGIRYATPELESILAPTYGIIVYQEQVMLIVQKLAGFSMGRADVIRKAMGKKKQDIMDAEKPNFIYGNKELGIKGCVNNGIDESIAENIWSQMVDFAKYAFNKSHAAAYAAISMQTAYLKANYPKEFAVGLLTSVSDDSDKLMKYIRDYRMKGINVLSPDINISETDFSLDENDDIIFGISAVKNVGRIVAKEIVKRRKNGKYKNLTDFVKRNVNVANKRAFENLAKAGALDCFGYTRRTVVENIATLAVKIKKDEQKADSSQLSLFDFGIDCQEDSEYEIAEFKEYSNIEKCRAEKESTGLYISEHPASSISKLCKTNGAYNIDEILDENATFGAKEPVKIYGIIAEITRKLTRKGMPMLIVKIEDETASISVFLFERTIEKYGKMIEEDSLVFLTGVAKGEAEDRVIILNQINSVKDVSETLWVKTDEASIVELEKQARLFQQKNFGIGDKLKIVSTKLKKSKYIGEISITKDVLTKAKIAFGPENIKVVEDK